MEDVVLFVIPALQAFFNNPDERAVVERGV